MMQYIHCMPSSLHRSLKVKCYHSSLRISIRWRAKRLHSSHLGGPDLSRLARPWVGSELSMLNNQDDADSVAIN